MEDTHRIEREFGTLLGQGDSDVMYVGLFDGHAGDSAAIYCRDHLHKNIAESFHDSADICEAMRKGFELTDHDFIHAAKTSHDESGSVAVSLLVGPDAMYIASAGDCRAVLCRQGECVLLTSDHKPTSCVNVNTEC